MTLPVSPAIRARLNARREHYQLKRTASPTVSATGLAVVLQVQIAAARAKEANNGTR